MLPKSFNLNPCTATLLALSSFTLAAPASAALSVKEANFKAALIYKMTSYINWLPPKEKVSYCFVGADSLAISSVLEQKRSRGQLQKSIDVSHYQQAQIGDLVGCDVIYAPHSKGLEQAVLTQLPTNVFTISNNTKALDQGFIASIELYNNKPLLTISKNNLKNANVSLNSRVLSYVDLR